MNLELFENWLGEQIYDMNNPLAILLRPRLKRDNKSIKILRKQQRTNMRDFQRIITKVSQLP